MRAAQHFAAVVLLRLPCILMVFSGGSSCGLQANNGRRQRGYIWTWKGNGVVCITPRVQGPRHGTQCLQPLSWYPLWQSWLLCSRMRRLCLHCLQ